ncbi:MAG: uridine kinase [Oligoflexia bacterium]|nr:uridine kinase [Oligoflexia bacterium]
MSEIIIIGVSGGSGSGKTTFVSRLQELLGNDLCSILGQDSYYIDQSHRFDEDGGSVNFDHPSALEFSLMGEHLQDLKKGNSIQVPIYDFATHTRSEEFIHFEPNRIVFVDGILIFSQPQVFENLDHKIFVDCPEDLRFSRRLKRDTVERGRTPEGVEAQFYKQVKPMHDQFVEPTKETACDVVNVENFDERLEHWLKLISKHL